MNTWVLVLMLCIFVMFEWRRYVVLYKEGAKTRVIRLWSLKWLLSTTLSPQGNSYFLSNEAIFASFNPLIWSLSAGEVTNGDWGEPLDARGTCPSWLISSGHQSFAVITGFESVAVLLRDFRVGGGLYKEDLVSVVEAGALGWEELVVLERVHFGLENVLCPSHVIQPPLSRRQSSLH